jgi:hypothetical protein
MKNAMKAALVAIVMIVGLGLTQSYVHADPPEYFEFQYQVTGFEPGQEVLVGNSYKLKTIAVTADFSGGLTGAANYVISYSINLVNGKATLNGPIVLEATSPCVGTFTGNLNGTSTANPDGTLFPDVGHAVLHGVAGTGCEGLTVNIFGSEITDGFLVGNGFYVP